MSNCPLATSRFFFFNDPATTEIYTLSLHDALPIFVPTDRAVEPDRPRQPGKQGRGDGDRPVHVEHGRRWRRGEDRKSTRLNSSHLVISYAVFCLKKKQNHLYHPLVAQPVSS